MNIKQKNFKLFFAFLVTTIAILLCTGFGIVKSVRSADAEPSPTPLPSVESNGVIFQFTYLAPESLSKSLHLEKYDSVAKGTVVDESKKEFVAASFKASTVPAEDITKFNDVRFYIGIDGQISPDKGTYKQNKADQVVNGQNNANQVAYRQSNVNQIACTQINENQDNLQDVPVIPAEKLKGTLVKLFIQYHDGSTGYVDGYFDNNCIVSQSLNRMFDYITIVCTNQDKPGPSPDYNPNVGPVSPETGIFATIES